MKRISILIAGLCLTANVSAGQKITDLMYMPEVGWMHGSSSIERHQEKYETYNKSTRAQLNQVDISHAQFMQEVNYGVLDNLSLGGSFGYVFSGTKETKTISTSQTSEVSYGGFSDIEFNGRYRVFTEQDFPVMLDGLIGFSPSFANKDRATVSVDGNALRGGHKLNLEVISGQDLGDFSWSSSFSILMNFKRITEDAKTSVELFEYDSRTDFRLGGKIQMNLGPIAGYDSGIEGGLSYYRYGSETSKLINGGSNTEYESYSDFELSGQINMEFIQDSLAGYFGFAYAMRGDQGVGTSYVRENQSAMRFFISTNYQF